ncbi:MAG: sulfite exporter TauE/SafE family protein [Opitutales bacterium]|nr:sulfite exporter TauE/SafE family protein [Opitutales bacterium]
MTPLEWTIIVAAISVSAGLLGSLAGVGGGIIVVPALTLLMGVDIRHAIAASIVAVVATSSAAASTYVRERMTNIRLGMLLETATALGAICGALAAGLLSSKLLYILFGVILCYNAWHMSHKREDGQHTIPPDPFADKLSLHASYYDRSLKRELSYRVSRTKLGLLVSWIAGLVSGLLGVGGGIFKVPLMHLAMGVPIKAATATSNFMIGITASTGAAIYFMRGDVKPFIAAPVAIGVIAGSKIGARLLGGMKLNAVRMAFVVVMAVAAVQMLYKGLFR